MGIERVCTTVARRIFSGSSLKRGSSARSAFGIRAHSELAHNRSGVGVLKLEKLFKEGHVEPQEIARSRISHTYFQRDPLAGKGSLRRCGSAGWLTKPVKHAMKFHGPTFIIVLRYPPKCEDCGEWSKNK